MSNLHDNEIITRALKFYADFIEKKFLIPEQTTSEQKKFIERVRGLELKYRSASNQ